MVYDEYKKKHINKIKKEYSKKYSKLQNDATVARKQNKANILPVIEALPKEKEIVKVKKEAASTQIQRIARGFKGRAEAKIMKQQPGGFVESKSTDPPTQMQTRS